MLGDDVCENLAVLVPITQTSSWLLNSFTTTPGTPLCNWVPQFLLLGPDSLAGLNTEHSIVHGHQAVDPCAAYIPGLDLAMLQRHSQP